MPVSVTRTRRTDRRSQGYWRWSVQQSGVTTYGATATDLVGEFKEIQDNNHPNYRKRLERNELMFSDLYVTESKRTVSDGVLQQGPYGYPTAVGPAGSVTKYYGDWSFKAEGVTGEIRLPSYISQDIVRLREVALVKAHARLDDAEVLGGELFGSAAETIRMLRRPFGGAQDLFRRMVKNRNRFAKRSKRSLDQATADTWLEYRYGWIPLILDSFAIMDLAAGHIVKQTGKWHVVRAGENLDYSVAGNFSDRLVDSAFKLSGSRSFHREISANAGVIYRVIPRSNPAELASALGLNARSVPATVWELVPYSFVADWFFNTGQWLSAITPNPDISVGGNWVTTVDKTLETMNISAVTRSLNLPPVTLLTGNGGGSTRETKVVLRYCNGQLPTTPTWTGANLSMLHAADAIALLITPLAKAYNKWIP